MAEGNELILGKVKDQMDGQKKTALLQNTIAAEFEQMRQWEKKYNSYLKTASGFASSLKACTHLYNDGVRIFISLCKLKKAISDNPQGIVAAMSMNNLYIETATELVTVFSLLRDAVANAYGSGTEPDPMGIERPTVRIPKETQPALPEHQDLHDDGRVEQRDGRYAGQEQW